MTNRILKGWNFHRGFRLVLGIIIIVQSILMKEWLMAGLGGLFTLMPIFNVGCCGGSACCDIPNERNTKLETQNNDITYEEIHS